MSDKDPIRNGIIASVAAGIILAALAQIWPPASRFIGWVWTTLGTGVTVPIWVFVVGMAGLLGIGVTRDVGGQRKMRRPRRARNDWRFWKSMTEEASPVAEPCDS